MQPLYTLPTKLLRGPKAMASAGNTSARSLETIIWDASRTRFSTEDGLAYLQYIIKSADDLGNVKQIDLVHTYVPPSKRGTGIAARLCNAAFQHAKEHNLQVIPTCSYISDTFLPRNPAWKDVVFKAGQTAAL